MKRKQLSRLLVGICLALVLAAIPLIGACAAKEEVPTPAPAPAPAPKPAPKPAPPAPKPTPSKIELTFASYVSESFSISQGYSKWMQEVEERTNRRVTFETFWSASLLGGAEVLEGVGKGIADLGYVHVPYRPALLPLAALGDMNYLPGDPWAVGMAMYELYDERPAFREQFDKQNIVPVISHGNSLNIMGFREQRVTTLEELRKVKLRALGGVAKVMETLGATPVAMTPQETYESIQSGILDGFSGYQISYADVSKIDEVAPHIADTGMGGLGASGLMMNKQTWDKLPDDIKTIIKDLKEEALGFTVQFIIDADKKAVENIQGRGGDLYVIPEKELKRWQDMCVPGIWDEWLEERSAKGLPAKQMFDEYRELLERYMPKSPWVPWTEYVK